MTDAASPLRPGPPTPQPNLLLVDDNEALRRFARIVLTRAGYRVIEAGSGEQALAELDRSGAAVDILVTDLIMPGMNGPELASRVAALCPAVRLLYITGFAGPTLSVPCGRPHALLLKPFGSEELVGAVGQLWRGSRV